MKKLLFTVVLVFIYSCTSDKVETKKPIPLQGKWMLVEQLLDPGDGSGKFESVESNRVIEFSGGDVVSINGQLCFMSTETGDTETGTYKIISSPTSDTTYDGQITPNICSSSSTKVFFNFIASGHLILWYECIEPCGQKFEKID